MSWPFRKGHFWAAQHLVISDLSELVVSLQVKIELLRTKDRRSHLISLLWFHFNANGSSFIIIYSFIQQASSEAELCARNHPSSWGPSNDDDMVPPSCGVLLRHFSYGLLIVNCPACWSFQEESSIPQMIYWTSFPPVNINFSLSPFCLTHPSVLPRSL